MIVDDPLDPDLMRAGLKTRRVGRSILVYERTASTNDVAAEHARNPDHDGLVVFAEEQTAGRGRTGAKWQSRPGDSLLFSFVLIDCDVAGELLALACAVAVAEAIGQVGGRQAAIKWPNDILLDDRKVAGILVESRVQKRQGDCRVGLPRPAPGAIHVIGIGINCHQTQDAFPDDLQTTATSLDMIAGTRCQRVTVAKRVLTSLDSWLLAAERSKTQVIETWSRLSTQLGRRVTLVYNDRRFTGNCIGVDPENGLILQLDRGGIRMFDAAHTRIAK
ncbi:MAG TPA: biotin--[acetyl-CoA-carboxylase] ligase [Sedimentisphaerales bacterium]|jgi:BirA family biotin operon repressor/biotin-[acetyl-CoA-carboxylase] ligase|nr:biotin--[acetyl-CoA-carboxylase] ligase [Sedimentisphaerales bacterium]HNU28945.1 biotin--[acetyl-CoA-carboxylase] ligase [Sedimentisphaerales bacterium]